MKWSTPSARKVLSDRTIYASRRIPTCTGLPVLCDLGDARIGSHKHRGDIMPGIYRAPEVILGMEWDYKVDIWSVGVMTWDIFEGERLFFAKKDGILNDEQHPAEMVSLLGPPPQEFIKRNDKCLQYWDDQGSNWKGSVPIPDQSFETREWRLKDGDRTLFLNFLRRTLRWMPEERPSAEELACSSRDSMDSSCTPWSRLNQEKLNASLHEIFREHLLWKELKEISVAHPKRPIKKALMHPAGACNFEEINNFPHKVFASMSLDWEAVKMLRNCNLSLFTRLYFIISDTHFESEIPMLSTEIIRYSFAIFMNYDDGRRPQIPAKPNCRRCSKTQFRDHLIPRVEHFTNVDWVKLFRSLRRNILLFNQFVCTQLGKSRFCELACW
ncbi:hypothetical protein GX51_05678 [Blastomyces parvus]|uniref:Protein kinase domain-containing protein n=1 Tax=Blastomyces parvus TaxID=2060905 RepID=A0A2B7WW13_9EURO|nr:hypothetical protein GX51_05678 [Blastomyces parvus]